MSAFTVHRRTFRKIKPEWRELNSQVTAQVNTWANRRDLQVYLGPDGGDGEAPALYDFHGGEIDVNTDIAFGTRVRPETVGDFRERDTHLEWPKAAGMILHEAAHAAHSPVEMITEGGQALTERELRWMINMEELRIEYRILRSYPDHQVFLRACALEVVLEGDLTRTKPETSVSALAQVAILAEGRVDAGSLKRRDVKNISKQLKSGLSEGCRDGMRALWCEFLKIKGDGRASSERARMYQIARDFDKLIKKEETASGTSRGTKPLMELLQALFDAMNADRKATEFAATDVADEMQARERTERQAKADAKESAREDADSGTAHEVFDIHNGAPGKSKSRRIGQRDPTAEEILAASQIADKLRKAKYRDHIKVETNRSDPPGRLRPRAAMQASAARSMTGRSERERYNPWRKMSRIHVEDPELTVGIMSDVSGSMHQAVNPIAVAVWALSNAVARIRGKSAAVYYGASTFSALKPGEVLKQVTAYSANDNYEEFDKGFRALNGGLKLLAGEGARLLIICSDGQYRPEQIIAVRKHLQACRVKGVAVVWLDFRGSHEAAKFCTEYGATLVEMQGAKVTDAAYIIGAACVKALANASQ